MQSPLAQRYVWRQMAVMREQRLPAARAAAVVDLELDVELQALVWGGVEGDKASRPTASGIAGPTGRLKAAAGGPTALGSGSSRNTTRRTGMSRDHLVLIQQEEELQLRAALDRQAGAVSRSPAGGSRTPGRY
jgi:hypothetical protein